MSKLTLLEPTPNKIAEVDDAHEEDSFSQEQALSIAQLNTQQSKNNQTQTQLQSLTLKPEHLELPHLNQHPKEHVIEGNVSSLGHAESMDASQIQLSLEQVSRYFQSRSRVETSGESRNDSCETVCNKVANCILEGVLNVNKQRRHLSFHKNGIDSSKLKQKIQAKKIDILQSLRQIQEQQMKLRAQKRSGSHKVPPRSRSQITLQDKQRLIQLIQARKQFEETIKKKNEQLIQSAKLAKNREEEQLKKDYQNANQNKKQKILQHLKELEQKYQQRNQLLKQSPLPKANTYSYKQKQRQWKRTQSLHDLEFKKKLKQLHQQHALNIEEISRHEKKYSLLLETRALSQSKIKMQSKSIPRRQKTQFDRLVEQQLFEMREKNQQKMLKIMQREFRQKIARYQQKIDQEHKPKADPSKTIVIPVEKDYTSFSLSKEERTEKGLEYLSKAKQMKKQASNIELSKAKLIEVNASEDKAYKNYLKQYVPFNPLKKELTKILSDREQKSNFQSVLRAKYLLQGLQEKGKRGGDNKMYSSMKNKLMLLQNLY